MSLDIIIPLSKAKITWLLVGCLIFIIFGVLFVISPATFVSPIMRSQEVIRISGIASIVFFGVCIAFIFRKLFDTKPGLTIDQYGITDNSNANSVGLIEWYDIIEIEKKKILSNNFLIIHTNNPQKYFDRAHTKFAKKILNMNYKIYGSPISIISSSLKTDFDNLEIIIRTELEKRKTAQ